MVMVHILEFVKDNYYTWFHSQLSLLQRNTLSSYTQYTFFSQSVKCRSRALSHGECFQSLSRTITMHGFTFPAITHILHKKYTDFPEANFVRPVVDRWKNGWLIYIYRTLL